MSTTGQSNVLRQVPGEKGLDAPGIAIEVEGATVQFVGDGESVVALEETSLSVPEQQFLAIVGPSGCGKSTLLNLVAALLPAKDSSIQVSGDVRVHGQLVTRPIPEIGYLFQTETLLPWLTVKSSVSLPLRFKKQSNYDERVRELIAKVGLAGFEDRYPRELSGGMRKRVQIAQVLAQDPEVILMDEPFGALDAQTRVLMQEELLDIWQKDAKTVVFVTHDLSEAILLSDRIVCLSARPGRVILDVEVPIERPRHLGETVEDPIYSRIFSEVWSVLQAEANISMTQVQT